MPDRLSDIEVFLAIVEAGGIAGGARALGQSSAAVSRRLTALEARLGTRLADRNARLFRPTQEGTIFVDKCAAALAQIHEAESEIRALDGSAHGRLRIGAPVDLGHSRIQDLAGAFADRHPDLRVHLIFSDAGLEVADDSIDVALRVGLPRTPTSIARKIATTRRSICASPTYFQKYGVPQTPADLTDHECLLLARREHLMDEWRFVGERIVKVKGRFSSGSGIALLKWALAGRGISLEARWDVEHHLRDGSLVECLAEECRETLDLYAVFHSGLMPSRVRLFVDFIAAAFKNG